jgi:hypothetical protein
MAAALIISFGANSTAHTPLPAGPVVLAVTIGKYHGGTNSFMMCDTVLPNFHGVPELKLHTPTKTYVPAAAGMTPVQQSVDAALQAGQMVSHITRLVSNPLVRARRRVARARCTLLRTYAHHHAPC